VLFFTELAGTQRPENSSAWKYQGFPVMAWGFQNESKLKKLKAWLDCFSFLYRNRNQIALMHLSGASPRSLFLAQAFQLIARKPAILKITLDGEDSIDAIRAGRHGWLASRLYLSLDAIVTMTRGQVKKLEEAGYRGEIRTIANGVDCERFKPIEGKDRDAVRERLNLPKDAFVLCYAGYLGERKGTDILLATFARLSQRLPNIHLLCVGNFSSTYEKDEALKAYCDENEVDPEIVDHPALHRFGRVDDMEAYMASSDLFLFPSRREGFGTVQIEAMACGLPCVVNYLPGVTEDIYPDDTVGVVLKDLDSGVWADAVVELLNDPERRARMGQAARRRVEEHFSIESVADEYIQLYEEILKH